MRLWYVRSKGGGGNFAYVYAHIKNCVQRGGGSKLAKMLRTYYMDAPYAIHHVSALYRLLCGDTLDLINA